MWLALSLLSVVPQPLRAVGFIPGLGGGHCRQALGSVPGLPEDPLGFYSLVYS